MIYQLKGPKMHKSEDIQTYNVWFENKTNQLCFQVAPNGYLATATLNIQLVHELSNDLDSLLPYKEERTKWGSDAKETVTRYPYSELYSFLENKLYCLISRSYEVFTRFSIRALAKEMGVKHDAEVWYTLFNNPESSVTNQESIPKNTTKTIKYLGESLAVFCPRRVGNAYSNDHDPYDIFEEDTDSPSNEPLKNISGFMHLFRNYRIQISGTENGNGDLGSSNITQNISSIVNDLCEDFSYLDNDGNDKIGEFHYSKIYSKELAMEFLMDHIEQAVAAHSFRPAYSIREDTGFKLFTIKLFKGMVTYY